MLVLPLCSCSHHFQLIESETFGQVSCIECVTCVMWGNVTLDNADNVGTVATIMITPWVGDSHWWPLRHLIMGGGHWPLAVRVRAFCLLKAWPGSAASLGLQKFTQTHELNLHKQIECHAFRRSITIGLETRYYCPLGLREKEVSTLIITPCKGYLGPKPLIINVSQIMRLDKHKRLWVSCEGRIKWSRLTPVTITPGTVSNDVWDWDSLEMDPKRLHL